MGWREEKAKADAANKEVQALSDEYQHVTRLGGASDLNSSGIVNRMVDSENFPGTEPERSWVRDWDTMEETIEDFGHYSSKHIRDMGNYSKFNSYNDNKKLVTYLNALAQYRPSLIGILGLDRLFKRSS